MIFPFENGIEMEIFENHVSLRYLERLSDYRIDTSFILQPEYFSRRSIKSETFRKVFASFYIYIKIIRVEELHINLALLSMNSD